MKSTVLIYGNCQAESLHALLRRVPSLAARCEFRVILYHLLDRPGRGWESVPEAWFAPPLVVWEQLTSTYAAERRAFHARLPAERLHVTFPSLSLMSLWPFLGHDPRAGEEALYPEARRYRVPDHVAAAIAAETAGREMPDSALFDAYMARSAQAMPDLARRLRMDEAQWRERDRDADLKAADYVLSGFRARRLFHDHSHLAAPPLGFLAARLAEMTLIGRGERAALGAELEAVLRGFAGQEWAGVPIHPLVAERLGLAWYDPAATVLWGAHELTFREWIVRYIRWMPWFS